MSKIRLVVFYRFAHLKVNLGCVQTRLLASCNQELLYAGFQFKICPKSKSKQNTIVIQSDLPGMTSSMARGARLKGSFESDNKWDLIVARSIIVFDDGNITGSRITVAISGSDQVLAKALVIEYSTYPRIHPGLLLGHLPLLNWPWPLPP
jgi:hypothetical protein